MFVYEGRKDATEWRLFKTLVHMARKVSQGRVKFIDFITARIIVEKRFIFEAHVNISTTHASTLHAHPWIIKSHSSVSIARVDQFLIDGQWIIHVSTLFLNRSKKFSLFFKQRQNSRNPRNITRQCYQNSFRMQKESRRKLLEMGNYYF